MAMQHNDDSSSMLADINVTPLVDVMLVLLIIFMVAAPMIQQGVEIDLPKAKAEALEAEESKMVLSIDDKKRIMLGGHEIPLSELALKLKYNEKLKADNELYLKADQNLPYGLIVQIMAMAKEAGIENVGMITEAGDGLAAAQDLIKKK